MIRYEQIKCRVCGGGLEELASGKYRCSYCRADFERIDLDQYEKAIRTSIREEVSEEFAKQRNSDIGAARRNLYAELKAEHISSYNVIGCCRKLKEYLPEDFQANTFELLNSGTKKQINKYIDGIDEKGTGRYYIRDILDFMIKSLVTSNVLSVKSLAERALNGKEKTEYLTRIEDEAKRYDDGIYNPAVPRDAFIAYSSKDMPRVNEVVNELKSAGIKCYVALENLRHGRGSVENYGNILEKAMHHCKCFVFMSSRNSRSFDCDAMEEMLYVQENEPKVKRIEYMLDDCDGEESVGVKDSLKEFFGTTEQCRDEGDLVKRIVKARTHKQETKTEDEKEGLKKQLEEYKRRLDKERRLSDEAETKFAPASASAEGINDKKEKKLSEEAEMRRKRKKDDEEPGHKQIDDREIFVRNQSPNAGVAEFKSREAEENTKSSYIGGRNAYTKLINVRRRDKALIAFRCVADICLFPIVVFLVVASFLDIQYYDYWYGGPMYLVPLTPIGIAVLVLLGTAVLLAFLTAIMNVALFLADSDFDNKIVLSVFYIIDYVVFIAFSFTQGLVADIFGWLFIPFSIVGFLCEIGAMICGWKINMWFIDDYDFFSTSKDVGKILFCIFEFITMFLLLYFGGMCILDKVIR